MPQAVAHRAQPPDGQVELVGLRGHRVVSICFFAVVTLLALVSFVRYQSPVWFLFVVILALLAFAIIRIEKRMKEPSLAEGAAA